MKTATPRSASGLPLRTPSTPHGRRQSDRQPGVRPSWSPWADRRRVKALSRPLLGIGAASGLLAVITLVVNGVAWPAVTPAVRAEGTVARAYNERVTLQEAPSHEAATPQATPKKARGERRVRPWLGIHARDVVFPADYPLAIACQGAMVVHVLPGGPADAAELRGASFEEPRGDSPISEPGDLIVAIDRLGVTSVDNLAYDLDLLGKRAGDTARLRVVRKTEILEVSIRLSARDETEEGAI